MRHAPTTNNQQPTTNNNQKQPTTTNTNHNHGHGRRRRGFHFFNVPHINNRPLKIILSYAKLKLNRRVGRQRQPKKNSPCERQISTHRDACIN
jgi:hypothetical protein